MKLPDVYVSNLSRRVNLEKLKLYSLKSHDCHVFMQRLLPIVFRELLPLNVWQSLMELSLGFKKITSPKVSVGDMAQLEVDIPIIMCKLERLFPPSVFNSMEHIVIHLA